MALWAIVPAAGAGERFGGSRPKQYLSLAGRPMLAHVLDLFLDSPLVEGVAVALAEGDEHWPKLRPAQPAKPLVTVVGGATRAASVLAALAAVSGRIGAEDWVLVHDAARPCLDAEDLRRLVAELADDPVGGILAAPVVDTLKRADDDGRIAATVERKGLWRALTPQMFRYGLLRSALASALADGASVTDEAAAVERAGFAPRLVAARAANPKVTRAEDLRVAELILAARR